MKFLIISIFFHVLILNFIWVGFSIQLPKYNSVFIYTQESATTTQKSLVDINTTDNSILEGWSPAFFQPWINMRQLEKPR